MVAVDELKNESAAAPKPERGVQGNETYLALVWRRLRRSFTGMVGLVLVSLLLVTAIFADFIAGAGETYSRNDYDMLLSVVVLDSPSNCAHPDSR